MVFITQHHQLRKIWLEHQDSGSLMDPAHQRIIHDFYRPAEALTDQELTQHRRDVLRTNKSLANRAGKIYARYARGEFYTPPPSVTADGRVVYVRSVLEPQPDLRQIAKVLVALAMEESKPPEHENRDDTDGQAA
ncbi:hypothetical protein J2W54_002366 [Rhodococcus fascians]|uniref:hypothetical protein n=1 Tax=Nocardiaceae TaxID=85025 RepID=UPI002854E47C|nr:MULTISPECIES: hypothetical protein [Rhodococcus]MDR6910649.1 hypothetical protein [Rhodococcus sp. 3258]MDR6931984.1 hypothetical protein [Rhodococcus fascians]